MNKITHKIKDTNRKYPTLLNKDGSWNIVCNTKLREIFACREWVGVDCPKCLKERN